MALVAVNALGDCPVARDALRPVPGAPVVVMIHGFRFSPRHSATDPQRLLFAPERRVRDARIVSWPRRLGFGRGQEGLAIGFGWHATDSLWASYAEAARAGAALARLVAGLRAAGSGPVSVIGHSLGARVALTALGSLSPGDIGRLVLLSGAEFHDRAAGALRSPAGRAVEVLNVTSRENDLFDFAFERLVGGPLAWLGPALGEGLAAPNAVTLQLDSEAHRAALRGLGFPVAPPCRLVCHWSAYLRAGIFRLYRRFLFDPAGLPLATLRAALAEEPAPRWSRLFPRPLPAEPIGAQ